MIDLPEGLYEVDQAYLVDVSRNRLSLRNVTFEIWLDKKGQKQLRGRGLINNFNFTKMLEDSEDVDLVLRFFDDYFLWLKEPVIQAGPVKSSNRPLNPPASSPLARASPRCLQTSSWNSRG
jgi:hypothetical protein